jgi:nucleotide-binding universal stress UspA family protein
MVLDSPGENDTDLKTIVVAFDGSKDSAKAIEVSSELAMKFKSDLIVVHVYASPMIAYSGIGGLPAPSFAGLEDAAKDGGQKVLDRGLGMAKSQGARARGELLEASSVVQALVEFASNEKADLVVVGTRGMTGFKKLILGSVSSGLVSHARSPVLVVR